MTSEIKVNNIKKASGSSITIGESGDTVSLASGATASGFGGSGAVNWQTTVKTHSPSSFTAVSGEGYFVNTTGGAVTVNLPAGSPGSIIAIKDYANTFDTNNLTVGRNSQPIDGTASDLTVSMEGAGFTLVYVNSTYGWLLKDK